MANEQWFYAVNGQQGGPVSLETLRGMIAGGQVGAEDLVWREGMAQWAQAGTIPELSPPPGAVPVAPPAPAAPVAPQGYPQHQQPGYGQGDPRNGYPTPGYPSQGYPNQGYPAPGYPQPGYPGQALEYYTPAQYVSYAGFWQRFAAFFLDSILVAIVNYGYVGILLGIQYAVGAQHSEGFEVFSGCSSAIVSIVVPWLYHAMMESSAKQASLGKMALGIVVTDEAGQRIGFGRATGRHFGKILSGLILAIGYIMAAFTDRKQALHDMMAGTLVIEGRR